MKIYDSVYTQMCRIINFIPYLYVVNFGFNEKKLDSRQQAIEKLNKQNDKAEESQIQSELLMDFDTHWFSFNKQEIKLETPVKVELHNNNPFHCHYSIAINFPKISIIDYLITVFLICLSLVLWCVLINEAFTLVSYLKNM
nr:uncharacterized protein LOC106684176 [Halyomorpha halys]